jgi:hypothetical protein
MGRLTRILKQLRVRPGRFIHLGEQSFCVKLSSNRWGGKSIANPDKIGKVMPNPCVWAHPVWCAYFF